MRFVYYFVPGTKYSILIVALENRRGVALASTTTLLMLLLLYGLVKAF